MFARFSSFLFSFLICALVLRGVFSFANTAYAATADFVTVQTTSLNAGDAANYTITFMLADDWSSGESIVIATPYASILALNEDDIDVAVEGVDQTTASNCAGSEQISLGYNPVLGNAVFTFVVCAGDGGGALAGQYVSFEIGTNAASSGLGTHQLVNPLNEGTYFFNVAGTSGNSASLPVPITDETTEGVSATVPSPDDGGGDDDGGGGGDGPPPDHPDDPPDDPEDPPEEPEDPPEEPEDPPEEPEEPGEEPEEPVTPETPEPPKDNGTPVKPINVDLFVSANSISLTPEDGEVSVFAGTPFQITVDVSGNTAVTSVVVVIGDDEYVLMPFEGGFSGVIMMGEEDQALYAIVKTADGREVRQPLTLHAERIGRVYEETENGIRGIQNAVVTAYVVNGGSQTFFDARTYGESNPILTSSGGSFYWYAPNGTYRIVAERDGYEENEITVTVRNNLLTALLPLTKTIEETPVEEPGETPNETPIEEIPDVLDLPEAEAVANIALPIAAATAVATTAILLGFNFLTYLQYLLTSPFLIFGRKKRRSYGIVYNAVTKVPIELAIVRAYRLSDGRLAKTTVTNAQGQYFLFLNEAGDYRLSVVKPGFVFPSAYMGEARTDGKYLDVYTNQIIRVTDTSAPIAANIPVDPSDAPAFQGVKRLRTKRLLRTFQVILAPLGVLLSVGTFVIAPTVFSGTMCVIQILILGVSIKLAWPKRPKGWGMVRSSSGNKPLGNVVVRLFEPRYNKLVESTLTDSRGRYSFLLGANEYYVSYDKPGFTQKIVRPIDYKDKVEPAPLTVAVELDPVTQG